MAQTITTITNAANLGGNTSIVCGSPTKTVLASTTLYVDLTVVITLPPDFSPSNLSSSVARPSIKLWYVILPIALTANGTLPQVLMQGANYMECKVPMAPSTQSVTQLSSMGGGIPGSPPGSITRCLYNNGGNLYTWFESPPLSIALNTPPTISIYSVESTGT